MALSDLTQRVRALIAGHLGLEEGDITPDANLLQDLGADSLDVVELVMVLEETFAIEVPDEDVEGMRTIGDVERYVADRIAA